MVGPPSTNKGQTDGKKGNEIQLRVVLLIRNSTHVASYNVRRTTYKRSGLYHSYNEMSSSWRPCRGTLLLHYTTSSSSCFRSFLFFCLFSSQSSNNIVIVINRIIYPLLRLLPACRAAVL